MAGETAALVGAIVLGVLYWVGWCWREGGGLPGLILKTGSTALLAVFAYMAGGPWLLVAGLALSSAGDAFLAMDRPGEDKWLKPGMAAFFLAHVAYVALFWALPQAERSLLNLGAQFALVIGGVAFVRWLAPSLGPMRIPVFAYTAIILVMGAAALRLPAPFLLVTLGAVMFVASDMILSLQLFTRPAGAPKRVGSSLAVWGLYFFGQALIAWGGVYPFLQPAG
ncbi:lysoplasmalogenase [uncultured Hyphomonas sp.]|uniref:lysoplasmalogenase n=1 Tax=uncultured Hyphomonas sp. TaxID=225298 RepID=UPI002AAB9002|nr:lysoplasmalogenase [uncultured Hyphomonas sp.]